MENVWKRSLFFQAPHLRGRSTLHFFPIPTPFIIVEGELSCEFKTTPSSPLLANSFLLLPWGLLSVLFRNARRDFQEQRADSSLSQTSASCAGAVGCGPFLDPSPPSLFTDLLEPQHLHLRRKGGPTLSWECDVTFTLACNLTLAFQQGRRSCIKGLFTSS